MTRSQTGALFWICVSVLMASCGGGGAPGTSSYIDRSGVYIGEITGFGSVIVGGVHFDTETAVIEVDDQATTESALRVGQYVRIEGILSVDGTTGTANLVTTDPALRGTVESIDNIAGTLIVLGTTVIIDIDTLFGPSIAPASLLSIAPGNRLEIQGIRNADGAILASRVDRTSDEQLEVRGPISNLDTTNQSFSIQTLSISYANADLVDFNGAPLRNGLVVEAEGVALTSGVLDAARLELEEDGQFEPEEEGTEVEISGIVTRFVSSSDFEVGGVRITTNSQTAFENGSAATLAADVSLSLEGTVNSQGVVLAESVEFRLQSNFEIKAYVESVQLSNSSLVILGTTITVSSTTQFVDESDAQLRRFTLEDVVPGDYVEVRGTALQSGVAANLLKRTSPEDELEISGAVTVIEATDIEILGTRIETTAQTEFEIDDGGVSQTQFFDRLAVGDSIEAEGQSPSPGILVAEKVERD